MGDFAVGRINRNSLCYYADNISDRNIDWILIVMNIDNNRTFQGCEDNNSQPRLLESSQLFGRNNEVTIRHKGSVYRLRITKNGKLIMNK